MLDFEIFNEKDFSLLKGMDPFKSIAVPRPIAWISTVSKDGIDNLAPFSQFTNVGFNHPHVLFAAQLNAEGKKKDTVVNAEETGSFVHNMVTYDLREAMNVTSLSYAADVTNLRRRGSQKRRAASSRPRESRNPRYSWSASMSQQSCCPAPTGRAAPTLS
mgnify:CR=1 FL=1